MAVSDPHVQHVSRAEANDQALTNTLGTRVVNHILYPGLGAAAGAALAGIGTVFMGAKVASAGIGAAGSVVGGVAHGGIWGLLGVAGLGVVGNTQTGSQLVNTGIEGVKNFAYYAPRVALAGGVTGGGILGHLYANSRNGSLVAAETSTILADNKAELASVEKARSSINNQPRMMAAANAQRDQLGLMRPGSSPARPRAMNMEATERVA